MELKKKYIAPEMRIIPMEHRDIITGSTDPDPQAEIDPFIWRGYWNILLPLFMSLLLGFSSCHDGDLPNPPKRELVPASFSVEIENDAETRLSFYGSDDTKMVFQTGDKIKLYDGCAEPHLLEYKNDKFEGSVCADGSYLNYRAVYPVSSTSSYNEVSISATQTAINGSFDKTSAPMIASYNHEQNKLSFKLAFSLLKITLPEGYSKIVVSNYSSTDQSYYLTGTATLSYSSEVSITKTAGKSSISLVPTSGQEIAAGTYYMCVFPCTLSGLQMACYKGDKISFKCKKANADSDKIIGKEGIEIGDLTASNWAFTCEAYKITPSGSSGSYYLADRNIGATSILNEGNSYIKSQVKTSIPSAEWGPGWSMPKRLELTEDVVSMLSNSLGEKYNIYYATISSPYLELYFPLGSYWGVESDLANPPLMYLWLSDDETHNLTTGSSAEPDLIENGYTAYIRPVFTVPVP